MVHPFGVSYTVNITSTRFQRYLPVQTFSLQKRRWLENKKDCKLNLQSLCIRNLLIVSAQPVQRL